MNEHGVNNIQPTNESVSPVVMSSSRSESEAESSQNKPSERIYSKHESTAALLILIVAFLSFRAFPYGSYPLGSFIVCLLSVALTVSFIYQKRSVPTPLFSYYFLILAVSFSAGFLFSSNELFLFLSFCAFVGFILLFLYFRCGSGTGKPSAEVFVFDVGKAFLLCPFSSGANALSAMIHPIKNGKYKAVGRSVKYIAAGLCIAVIPTAFVLSNLSFEHKFVKILSDIFVIDGLDVILENVFSILFAIPLTLYIFSAVSHYNENESDETKKATATSNQKALEAKRILPSLTVVTAAVPILFLYVVFFISQIEEYTAAFTGKLPDGFIYSEYARSGFFELCRVAALNAAFIVCARAFTKSKDGKPTIALRAVSSLICISSLVLIATAMAKMILYIDVYGMTQKRVYVSLFMILMSVGFIFCLVSQIFPRLKMTWICIALASLMLIIPSYTNIDAIIASYNVDRYISGAAETLDLSIFTNAKEASMPALSKLYKSDRATEPDKKMIESYAKTLNLEYECERSVFTYSIPKAKAISAINEILEVK